MPSLLFYIPRLQFLRRVVLLNRLRDYRTGRVSALVVLALRRYRPRHIARTQTKRNRQTSQYCRYRRCNDFVDLLFTHSNLLSLPLVIFPFTMPYVRAQLLVWCLQV